MLDRILMSAKCHMKPEVAQNGAKLREMAQNGAKWRFFKEKPQIKTSECIPEAALGLLHMLDRILMSAKCHMKPEVAENGAKLREMAVFEGKT